MRRAYAGFERGNFAIAELFDPSVRIRWLDAIAAGQAESVGFREVQTAMEGWLASFEHVSLIAEQIVEIKQCVVVIARFRGRGRASGAPTELRHGQIWDIRDGKVLGITSYDDPDDALEAAGLEA